MTLFAGSPCAKTFSFPRNLPTFLPKPAESRNNCTSKAGLDSFAFLGSEGPSWIHVELLGTHPNWCTLVTMLAWSFILLHFAGSRACEDQKVRALAEIRELQGKIPGLRDLGWCERIAPLAGV